METNDTLDCRTQEKLSNDLYEEAKFVINSMQAHNYKSDYEKTKELYNKYYDVFADDIFFSNKILNETELATHKIILDSKPRNVTVILTNTCDLKCIMCGLDNTTVKNISKKLIDIILDNLQYFERLTWQGGEVLTLPYFKNIMTKVIEFPRIHQTVISNFQNVSNEIIELISQNNNMTLTISIDGAFKETYEKIRAGAKFGKLEKNLKKLNEYITKYKSRITIKINFVIMPMNYKEIPDMVDFAYRYKISMIGFMRCITENETLKITKEYEKEVEFYIKKAQEKAEKCNIIIIDTFSFYNDNNCNNRLYDKNLVDENKGLFCHLPWYEMLIQEDDTVKPHCACGYTSFKNIESYNNIDDIWNNEVMQNYRNHMLTNKYGSCIQKCKLMSSYDTRKKFTK